MAAHMKARMMAVACDRLFSGLVPTTVGYMYAADVGMLIAMLHDAHRVEIHYFLAAKHVLSPYHVFVRTCARTAMEGEQAGQGPAGLGLGSGWRAPGHEQQAAARLVDHHVEALLLEARAAKQEAAPCVNPLFSSLGDRNAFKGNAMPGVADSASTKVAEHHVNTCTRRRPCGGLPPGAWVR